MRGGGLTAGEWRTQRRFVDMWSRVRIIAQCGLVALAAWLPCGGVGQTPPPRADAEAIGAVTSTLPPPAPMPDAGATPASPMIPNVARADFVRGVVVDASGPALRSPESVRKLVADCRAHGLNTIIAQVRSNGDALYKTVHAPMEAGIPDGFDPLAALLVEARQGGQPVRVYAMLTMLRVWSGRLGDPPAGHVVRKHPEWLTCTPEGGKLMGENAAEQWLDPGVPAVQDYVALLATDVTANYALDGIVFDRMRYADTDLRSGYNTAALDAFNKARGRTFVPAPDDTDWVAWRRDQLSETVRKSAQSARVARPGLRVVLASVTYGNPPATRDQYMMESIPYTRALSDWVGWCEKGYADANLLLNYKPADAKSDEFAAWWRFALENKGRAQMLGGVGGWLNSARDTAAMLAVCTLDARSDGVVLYSYAHPARPGEPTGMAWSAIAKAFDAAALEPVASALAGRISPLEPAAMREVLTLAGSTLMTGAAAAPAISPAALEPSAGPSVAEVLAPQPSAVAVRVPQEPSTGLAPPPAMIAPSAPMPAAPPSLSALGQDRGAPLPGQELPPLPADAMMQTQPLRTQPSSPADMALDRALAPTDVEARARQYVTPRHLLPEPTPAGPPRSKGESNWAGQRMDGPIPQSRRFEAPNVMDIKPTDAAPHPDDQGMAATGSETLPGMEMAPGMPGYGPGATVPGASSATGGGPALDTVHLKGGKTFQGTVLQEGGRGYQIRLPGGGVISIPTARVDRVERAPGRAASPER